MHRRPAPKACYNGERPDPRTPVWPYRSNREDVVKTLVHTRTHTHTHTLTHPLRGTGHLAHTYTSHTRHIHTTYTSHVCTHHIPNKPWLQHPPSVPAQPERMYSGGILMVYSQMQGKLGSVLVFHQLCLHDCCRHLMFAPSPHPTPSPSPSLRAAVLC